MTHAGAVCSSSCSSAPATAEPSSCPADARSAVGVGAVSEAPGRESRLRDSCERAGVDRRAAEVVLLGRRPGLVRGRRDEAPLRPLAPAAQGARPRHAARLRDGRPPDPARAWRARYARSCPAGTPPTRSSGSSASTCRPTSSKARSRPSTTGSQPAADPGPGDADGADAGALARDRPGRAAALRPGHDPRPRHRVERRRRGHACRRAVDGGPWTGRRSSAAPGATAARRWEHEWEPSPERTRSPCAPATPAAPCSPSSRSGTGVAIATTPSTA